MKIMQKTKRNRKAGDVHKLLVLAREGEAVVLDPSEHNSNAFVPLSEVLETLSGPGCRPLQAELEVLRRSRWPCGTE